MIIHVTQEHINRGKRNRCFECPVSIAIQEQMARPVAVVTETLKEGFFFTKMHGLWYGTKIHEKITELIARYDFGEKMQPFCFTMPDTEVYQKVVSGSRVGNDY